MLQVELLDELFILFLSRPPKGEEVEKHIPLVPSGLLPYALVYPLEVVLIPLRYG